MIAASMVASPAPVVASGEAAVSGGHVVANVARARAVASGRATVSTIGAEVTPVDGPVLNLRWGSTAEVTQVTATDYGALSFLIAVFAAVLMATEDAETSGAAVMLAWLLLTCPQTRGAILRLTRSMHGD